MDTAEEKISKELEDKIIESIQIKACREKKNERGVGTELKLHIRQY